MLHQMNDFKYHNEIAPRHVRNTVEKIVFNRKTKVIKEFDQEILKMQYRPISLKSTLSVFLLAPFFLFAQQGQALN